MIMDAIMAIFNVMMAIADWFFGWPMLFLTGGVAIIYTIYNRGFQFNYLGFSLKRTLFIMKSDTEELNNRHKRGVSSFKATCMALSNTLGVGNIAGVSLAISMGGPGAIFWIWIAGFFGTILKYGEIVLGVKYRELDSNSGMYHGGIMWYIEKGLGPRWKWMAVIYALVYLVAGVNGPAVQVNTLATSVTSYDNRIPPMAVGIITVIILAMVLLGGLNRISEFAGRVVPMMSLIYIVVSLTIIVLNFKMLPQTVLMIFKYAFNNTPSIIAGFGGATVATSLRYGIARGFYSNGAGVGDSPFAHSTADVSHPCEQGIWGITEVVVDAIVCTATGLMVLITGAWMSGESGAPLTARAIGTAFGNQNIGSLFIIVMVFFFALTTAVMCAYYGEICITYFTKNQAVLMIYRFIICAYSVFCTNKLFVERLDIVWRIGDFNSAISMIISLTTLLLLRKDVARCTKEYVGSIQKKKRLQ